MKNTLLDKLDSLLTFTGFVLTLLLIWFLLGSCKVIWEDRPFVYLGDGAHKTCVIDNDVLHCFGPE